MKKYFFLPLIAVTFSFAVFAAQTSNGQALEKEIKDVRAELALLTYSRDWIREHLNDVWQAHLDLKEKVRDLQLEVLKARSIIAREAFFDLKEGINGSYQSILCNQKTFFITLERAVPELGGYRLYFLIGNPSAATYSDVKLKIKWNRSFDDYWSDAAYTKELKDYLKKEEDWLEKIKEGNDEVDELPEYPTRPDWEESLKEKEFSIAKDLLPGRWTRVDVHITPAKIEELGYVEVSIDALVVKLKPAI